MTEHNLLKRAELIYYASNFMDALDNVNKWIDTLSDQEVKQLDQQMDVEIGLLSKRIEEGEELQLTAGDGVKIGGSVIALLRQIATLGK